MKKFKFPSGSPVKLDRKCLGRGLLGPWRASRRARALAVVMVALVHGAAPGVAAAQDRAAVAANSHTAMAYAEQADPAAGLRFETSTHRAWYGVFWSGECADLAFLERLVCLKGQPTWTEITRMVVAKSQPDARAVVRYKMNRLGRIIGFEWARHNDERRIDSDDLKRWSNWLEKTADVDGAVDRMAEAARRLIQRP